MIKGKFLVLLTYLWVVVSTGLSLYISLLLIFRPSPLFPSSYWDIRWLWIFAILFGSIVALFFLAADRLLLFFALLSVAFLIIVPLFTIDILLPYLTVALILLIGFGVGDTVIQTVLRGVHLSKIERFAISVLMGLGIIMILRSFQGAFGLFSFPITVGGLGILFFLFVLTKIKRWINTILLQVEQLGQFFREGNIANVALILAVFVLLFAPSWMIALAPPIRYDELTYHLSGSQFYVEQGGIIPFPEGGNNPWLHYAEMLYSLGIELGGLATPRLFHLTMTLLSVLFVYLLGNRLFNRRTGIIAGLLFFSIPLVAYEGATGYIDLFVTAFTTAFGFCLLGYSSDLSGRWLILAGFFGGIGLGIKLSAGPILVGFLACFAVLSLFQKTFFKILFSMGVMGSIILILCLPWWIRDYSWTGDPFFPYGGDLVRKLSTPIIEPARSTQSTVINSDLIRFISYPIDIVLNSRKYYHEAPGGMVATMPFLALPLWLFSSFIPNRTKKFILVGLCGSMIAIGVMMIVNNALLRYALPVFPWFTLSAVANVYVIYKHLENKESWLGGNLLFLLLLAFGFSTRLPIIARLSENLPQRLPINYFLGRENREDYLSRNLPVYDAYQFIDQQPGGRHRVLSVGNEFRLYTSSRIDGVWDVKEAHQLLISAHNESELATELLRRGYEYILINQPEVEYVTWKYDYPILNQSHFLVRYCQLIFAKNGILVYKIFPEPLVLPQPNNLVQNESFEETSGDQLVAWYQDGSIFISNEAYEGTRSLLLYGPLSDKFGWVKQKLEIESNQLYTFGYWAKALGNNAILLMQLRWLDENENLIESDEIWKNVETEWNWFYWYSQSPQNSKFVEIYLSLGNSEGVLFDQVCLAAGQTCPMKEQP